MTSTDILKDILGGYNTEQDDGNIYHCVECKWALTKVLGANRKMFFCSNKNCERYGFVVTVAINRNK
jgi:hypothetical protein